MSKSMQLNLPPVQLQKMTGGFAPEAKPDVTLRQSVKWNEIPETAFDCARLQRKSTAADLRKSHSWFCRALKGLEKLGWADLGVIDSKEFWAEMVDLILDFHGLSAPGLSAQDQEDMRVGRLMREIVQRSAAR
jgi:hypothetical protein